MYWKDKSYGETYTSRSKMKDIGVYFGLELNEIGTYCLTATKVRHIGYAIKYLVLVKAIKKAYLSYFRYKTIQESIKMSDHG